MEQVISSTVVFGAVLALFTIYYRLVADEMLCGQRRFGSGWRAWLDERATIAGRAAQRAMARRAARPVAEPHPDNPTATALFRHATNTPLTVTHTDNHLSKMRDHKVDTALTPTEKRKLSKKKLEERF